MSDIPQMKLHYDKTQVNLYMISVLRHCVPLDVSLYMHMCVSVCEKIHWFKSCTLNCWNIEKVIQKNLILRKSDFHSPRRSSVKLICFIYLYSKCCDSVEENTDHGCRISSRGCFSEYLCAASLFFTSYIWCSSICHIYVWSLFFHRESSPLKSAICILI